MVDINSSNPSPLLYLHRIEALDWLPELGEKVLIPYRAVVEAAGQSLALERHHGSVGGAWPTVS